MQTAVTLLPNHFAGIYEEMKGEAERRLFEIDFKGLMKGIIEDVSLVEFEETVVGVPPYLRGEGRLNHRNGFYERSLDTVFGWIEGLKIPRPRYGGFTPRCLGRKYTRRQEALNRLVVESFRRGISTRDVEKVLKALCDVDVSATTVSRLTSRWDVEARRWHQRELVDDYVYLMADGIWIKNRSLGVKRRLILVVYGIKRDGKREIIDYAFARSEKEENWLKFLTNLQHRGLEGKHLKLITTDGCVGLANAIAIAFPCVPHQLCWAHKMRNVLKGVRTRDLGAVKAGLSPLFDGIWTEKAALTLINRWVKKWKTIYPKSVHCLEKDMDRLLLYLGCDLEHHKAIRTSNHIERQFKEYRRRMRPMEIIPNQAAADRMLYALTMIRNEKLGAYPLHFTQKTLH
jgi:transposase-like protein